MQPVTPLPTVHASHARHAVQARSEAGQAAYMCGLHLALWTDLSHHPGCSGAVFTPAGASVCHEWQHRYQDQPGSGPTNMEGMAMLHSTMSIESATMGNESAPMDIVPATMACWEGLGGRSVECGQVG